MEYKDKKIYLNSEHIGYIDFSFYEDIKALGIGDFEIINKRKGYGTLVIKDIINKYKNKYNLIYCFVDKENIGAIKFYKKVGKVCTDIVNEKDQYQVILYEKEDIVVISRKRYDKLRSLYDEVWDAYYDGENNAKVYYEGIKIPQARKEMADKIVTFLEDYCDCDSVGLVEQLKEYLTKEQFNVETKE